MILFGGILLLLLGGYIHLYGNKILYKLSVYEFENRTDGGVIQFDTFEDSEKHDFSYYVAYTLMIVGVILFICGVLLVYNFFK